MSAPKPLTETPAPSLDWSRPDTPAARNFDDIYFSVDGGLEETELVFLTGCGLPERWTGQACFTIGELGFGTGLNFLAAWRLWEKTKPSDGRLHFVSIEKFPLDQSQMIQALSAWPELKHYADRLIAKWPGRVRGLHRLDFDDVILTLVHEDVDAALDQLEMQADAWFLDGFSPSKNPKMWSDAIFEKLAGISAPACRLSTFSVAGFVRDGLSQAGFEVEKKPGFGRKRHRLEARLIGSTEQKPTPIQPVIIGGGIAGASLAHAFLKRDIKPVMINADDGTAASGNAAAIVKPRLDLQDRPESRFFLSAFLHARHFYQDYGTVLANGVIHLNKDEKDEGRSSRLLAQRPLPERLMSAASDDDGISFPEALVVDPIESCKALVEGAELISAKALHVQRNDNGLKVIDEAGQLVASGSHVFWACGAGIRSLDIDFDIPVRFSRGQISWAETKLDRTLTYGGYGIPLAAGTLIGATHDRLDDGNPYKLSEASDQKNLQEFTARTGLNAKASNRASRVSIRVNMPDTLPRMIDCGDDQFVFTGLGSRGFVFAPLMAEAMVSRLLGEPVPIDKKLWARFQAREKPNLKARPSKDMRHNQDPHTLT